MNNTAINTLRYSGVVTLSQYIGSKKIKIAQANNTGGNSLFDFLADCLVGDFNIARVSRPTKIKLLSRTAEQNRDGAFEYRYTSHSGFIYLLSKPEKVYTSAQTRVRYSFLIPRDMLETITSGQKLGLGLYTNGATEATDLENFAAFCELDLDQNVLANTSLVVDWELIIANNGSNTSSGYRISSNTNT